MEDILASLRSDRRIRIGLVVILLVIAFFTFLRISGYGYVSIKSDNGVLLSAMPSGGVISVLQGTGSISGFIPTGSYTISASKYTNTQQKVYVVKPFFNSEIRLEVPENVTVKPVPVAPIEVQNGGFSNTTVKYLGINGSISILSNDTSIVPVSIEPNLTFDSGYWADSDHAIFRQPDTLSFYYYNGKEIIKIEPPTTFKFDANTLYTIDTNGRILFADRGTIYTTSNIGKTYRKVYRSDSSSITISSTKNGDYIAILESSPEQRDGVSKEEPKLVIITLDGKKIATKQDVDAYEIVLSPDGSKIAISGDSMNEVLRIPDMSTILVLPAGNTNQLTWKNSSLLVYNDQRNIWALDIEKGQSRLVSTVPSGQSISYIGLGQDDIYFNSRVSGDLYQLSKISLSSPKPKNDIVYRLARFLPTVIDSACFITYSNVTQPRVSISGINDNPVSNCLDESKQYLQTNGIDLNQVELVVE